LYLIFLPLSVSWGGATEVLEVEIPSSAAASTTASPVLEGTASDVVLDAEAEVGGAEVAEKAEVGPSISEAENELHSGAGVGVAVGVGGRVGPTVDTNVSEGVISDATADVGEESASAS
jgi:hypothetical protein